MSGLFPVHRFVFLRSIMKCDKTWRATKAYSKMPEESSHQNQGAKEHRTPKFLSSISLNKNLRQRCCRSVEARTPDSLSIICNEQTQFNVPRNTRSSSTGLLIDGLKTYGRKKGTSDLGKFVVKCASAASPENVIISPVGQWILNAIEGNRKVKNVWRSSFHSRLGSLDSKMNLERAKSVAVRDKKLSEFLSSSSALITPQEPEKYGYLRKRRCASEVTDSSSRNSSSDQSTSSASSAVSKGLIHCIWNSGVPFFVFSVDDQGELYVANPCTEDSLDDNRPNYMYLFCSRRDIQTEQGWCSSENVPDIVGKMKVVSYLALDSSNSKHLETEFVMFGASEDSFRMVQSPPTPTTSKNKGLQKKVADVLRKNYYKHKSTKKSADQSSKLENFSHKTHLDMFGRSQESGRDSHIDNRPPSNLELAAIVVKAYLHNYSQMEDGGWGLKFLKDAPVEAAGNHRDSCAESCRDSLRNENEALMDMKVIVPAGFHGSPRTDDGGPSSLIERLNSGGCCDCGGWDTGCPLTVLNYRSSNTEIWPETEKHEECRSFDLYVEGLKQGVPTLEMVNIHEGLYFVHFQSPLSALQSFSIGVAIIHAQSHTVYPKI
ncbi:hypothetical protein AAC387_Pa12g1767 [Persea americana]